MKTKYLILFIVASFALTLPATSYSSDNKVYIGLNAEFGHITSTSDDAIKQGILIAIDEINRSGGVLEGRQLGLIIRDNRAVPARAIQNNKELAAMHDLVAVFCGKFSSAVIESLPVIHELRLILLNPWAANDKVIDNGYNPNYAFRLSLKDSWAIPAMMKYAKKQGFSKLGVLLINTSWGRNNLEVIRQYAAKDADVQITEVQWFNYGDKSLLDKYNAVLKSGAQAVILVAIEAEGAILVKDMAGLPRQKRLPVISHWAIAGGDFPALTGPALGKVNLAFVQTFDLHTNKSNKARSVLATARKLLKVKDFSEVKSPAGLAHAYDLTHILALAINKAGSTDRRKIRNALEQVTKYDGLIKSYEQPFTGSNHEALGPDNLFMARYNNDGTIEEIK